MCIALKQTGFEGSKTSAGCADSYIEIFTVTVQSHGLLTLHMHTSVFARDHQQYVLIGARTS